MNIKLQSTALFILLLFSITFGQNIFGTWVSPQINATMTLNQDGTFVFDGPNGHYTGAWGVQGQSLVMQDQLGQMYQYAVTQFSDTVLHLMDGYGNAIAYERPLQTRQQTTILAESNGLQLNSGHVQTGIGIIQFIIGQEIKPNEVEELTQSSIEEFQTYPQEFIRQITSLQQSLTTIKSLQDPLQIGTLRQMLIAEFYKATLPMKEADKPLLIRVMNRYVKVLAFDEANNLVLTNKDVTAMIDYIVFSNQLSGIIQTVSNSDREQFTKELVQQFTILPLEQKQFLCSASLAWDLVQKNWQNMAQNQRAQVQQNYAGSVGSQNQQVYNGGTPSQQEMAQMQRDFNAQQNMMTMMNNMSLQNHATMLNTIENFGGTGNYWEVTDMGY